MKKLILFLLLFFFLLSCSNDPDYMTKFIKDYNKTGLKNQNLKEYFFTDDIYNIFVNSKIESLESKILLSNNSIIVWGKRFGNKILFKIDFKNEKIINFDTYIPKFEIEKISDTHIKIKFCEKQFDKFFNTLDYSYKVTSINDQITNGFSSNSRINDNKIFDFNANKKNHKNQVQVKSIDSFEINEVYLSD